MRRQYGHDTLNEQTLMDSPLLQFAHWFGEVNQAGCEEPNAMVLSTVDNQGFPNARYRVQPEAGMRSTCSTFSTSDCSTCAHVWVRECRLDRTLVQGVQARVVIVLSSHCARRRESSRGWRRSCGASTACEARARHAGLLFLQLSRRLQTWGTLLVRSPS